MKRWQLLLCAALIGATCGARAQDKATIDQGLQYMQSVKPTMKGQIVNPAAVNSSAWTSTTIPTAVPQNMGPLSNPNTSTTTLGSAKALGLGGWGMKTQTQCATYVVGSGDAYLDQQCAAVNFLSNSCLSLNSTQTQVTGGVNHITAGTTSCAGSYGAGQANFNFHNTITANDTIFGNIKNARDTSKLIIGGTETCVPQTVVTKPEKNELNTCVQSTQTDALACNQYLNTVIVTAAQAPTETQSCSQGVQVGNYCQASESGAANINYACPAGYTLAGSSCVGVTTIPATIISYTCSAGLTLSGNQCVGAATTTTPASPNYYCPSGTLIGTNCTTSSTTPANPVYGCPAGYSLSGTTCTKTETTAPTVTYSCPNTVSNSGMVYRLCGNTENRCTYCFASGIPTNARCSQVADGLGTSLIGTIAEGSTAIACTVAGQSTSACPGGYTQSGSNCIRTSTTVATISSYSCTSGTVSGSNCVTTQSTGAQITYSCPAGQTVVGTNCTQTTTVTSPATPTYSCPADSTLSGTSCIGTIEQAATVSYSCPAGATLSGTTCITTITVPVTIVYSCVDGSAPIGGVCQIKSVQSNWTNTCGVYEDSAGIKLPTPN